MEAKSANFLELVITILAALKGDVPYLEQLQKESEYLSCIIDNNYYELLLNAVHNGHLSTLQYLEKQSPQKFKKILEKSGPISQGSFEGAYTHSSLFS